MENMESEKVTKFRSLMEIDIENGIQTNWKELLSKAEISQPYSHKVRETNAEIKAIHLKWKKLPKAKLIQNIKKKEIKEKIINKNIEKIGQDLCKLISERLSNESYTTERSITYTFFLLLVQKGLYQPHELLLEYPHSIKESNERVDTYVEPTNFKKGLVMECKYDRKNRKNTTLNKTNRAGAIFNDLFRLAAFKKANTEKWFIYLTDNDMSIYLSNPNNKLNDFFNLEINDDGLIIDNRYWETRPKSFKERINKYGLEGFGIKCILKEDDLPKKHKLRIYEVIDL
jgi:hypothetical protein